MDKKQIAEWYHKYVTFTNEGRDDIYVNTMDMLSAFAAEFISHTGDKCNGNCGMNYCEDNGCIERKRVLREPADPLPDPPKE